MEEENENEDFETWKEIIGLEYQCACSLSYWLLGEEMLFFSHMLFDCL